MRPILPPTQRRRELRGYRVFAAWLNHDDSRSLNTFDSYVEDNGRHYIRHYLLDFGSNLGSATTSAQQPRAGNDYYIEAGKIFKGILTFGLWSRDWMHVRYPAYPAVGNIEAEFFDAPTWKPQYPNPAFNRTIASGGGRPAVSGGSPAPRHSADYRLAGGRVIGLSGRTLGWQGI